MRKLFLFLITMFLCLSIVSADDTNSTDVNYHVDSSYTWQIHSTIDFGSNAGVGTTVNRTAQIGQDNLGVAVTKNIIPDGATLVISLADSNTFRVVNGNTSLGYTVAKTSGGTALAASDSVLEVAAGTNTGSQALYFALTTGSGESEVAGTYTGIITYNAEITGGNSNVPYTAGSLVQLTQNGLELVDENDIDSLEGVYRIMSVNSDNEAKVMALWSPEEKEYGLSDGSVPNYEFDNGGMYAFYGGGAADEYLNDDFYNALPSVIKNAIVDQEISIYAGKESSINIGDPVPDNYILPMDVDDNYLFYAEIVDTKTVGYRHVYEPGLQDIIDYFGTSDPITSNDISMMFYNRPYESSGPYSFDYRDILLRDSSSDYEPDSCWWIFRSGADTLLPESYDCWAGYERELRPMFVLDLDLLS